MNTQATFQPGNTVEALKPYSRRGRDGGIWIPATIVEAVTDPMLGTSYLVRWANMMFWVDQVRPVGTALVERVAALMACACNNPDHHNAAAVVAAVQEGQ